MTNSLLLQNLIIQQSKHFLVKNELRKLQKFDSSYFRGRNRFEEDGFQIQIFLKSW